MTRIIAYVDGFNLYHAIHELNRPSLKWLDLWALTTSLARPGETVVEVNYFSAFATWRSDAHKRHIDYVKALEHVGVTCIMGHFKSKTRTCKSCGATWVQHEEKETDVHIASRIVVDACENRFDRAVLITADSDLAPALNIVKARFANKQLFVVAPPGRHSHARSLNTALTLTPGRLAKCILLETASDPSGRKIFRRPASYY
jgi:NYN domain